MPKQTVPLQAFNRGVVSPKGLARTDLENIRLFAETQTNWMPEVLGPMSLRPGTEKIAQTHNDSKAFGIPFIYSRSDKALLEFTNEALRIFVDDTLISRASVSTTITNSDFSTASDWTDDDDASCTSTITGGQLTLVGTGYNKAARYQAVTVSAGDIGTRHAIEIDVAVGPVLFRVGSTAGGQEYIIEQELDTGFHSIAFTPTNGTFYVWLGGKRQYTQKVNSCTIASSGTMVLTTPYAEADLPELRYVQSADVVFIVCDGYKQRKVERRGANSWSFVEYTAEDGPFRLINTTSTRLTPSALNGDITITASDDFFTEGNIGSLIKITSVGQVVEATLSGEGQYSDYIRVIGTGASQRQFTVVRTGTWTATITLQRSNGEPGSWVDVTTYTGNGTATVNDGLDNQITYYRVGIKTGDYTSGSADVTITYEKAGGISGIAEVTAYTDTTTVDAIVYKDFGGADASEDWYEGSWSTRRGYPTSIGIYEGRLIQAGRDKIWGSVSDAYYSYDDEYEGDAGPFNRSIGFGPVDSIHWVLPLQRLMLGGDMNEYSIKATTFDEPLAPDNFNLKSPSSQGSAAVAAVAIDSNGFFLQGSGRKIYGLKFTVETEDYTSEGGNMMLLSEDIAGDGIVRMVAQRQPDTRLHCPRTDGKVAILVFDAAENVKAWVLYETDGVVEDVVVFPGDEEDEVYYCVKRTINGADVRFWEKWAKRSECVGGTDSRLADCHLRWTGSSTTTITGLSYLEGESVVAWGNGKDLGDYTVSGGSITLSEAVTSVTVGLPYTADYKSGKLAYAARMGTAINQKKRLAQLGLVLIDTHCQGLLYGPDANNLDNLPMIEDGAVVADDTIHEYYDFDMLPVYSDWDTDARVYLQAAAPRPCTVSSLALQVKTHEKA